VDSFEPFISLAVALGVGLLIGLERERSAPSTEDEPARAAGARTHGLVSLSAALSMLVAAEIGAWFVAIPFLALLVLVGIAYADDVRHGRDRGLTSESALILTFILGALATSTILNDTSRRLIAVSAIAVVTTTLLSLKGFTQSFAKKISREDLYGTLKFLIALVIVLPLLPDRAFGPFEALNAFHIGTMILLIAALGFVGYVAVRVLGPGKGLGVTGLIGGMVSSTAVTLSMAARAKNDPEVALPCTVAVLLASSVMYARILVEVAVVHRPLVAPLLIPMAAMLVSGLAVAAFLYRKSRAVEARAEQLSVSNPFELGSAVKFGLLFAVVLLASKAASHYFGAAGAYLAGALAGLTDVDAITLSMADLARGGMEPVVAVRTIFIAAVSNTLVKLGMAIVLGGAAFARAMAPGLAIVLAAGAVALFFV
jgi:uncharacterized membrane protein (DUF4010 family)